LTVPVVDTDNQVLGVITVDDILEATIPDDWRRREPPPHPESPHVDSEPNGPASTYSEHQG
jgi:CBS domain containing-hemolysin-like protein